MISLTKFDTEWRKFATHHYNTRQQIDYIKQIKSDNDDQDKIVVEMDFAENHNLVIQHQIQQAHYNSAQATIYTINIHVTNKTQHAVAIISDCLDHDVNSSMRHRKSLFNLCKIIIPMLDI